VRLNQAQQQAVEHESGPLLVLAGAGSGKTGVVTRRIARLIERGVPASAILAMTFTNKAAGEMHERVARLVGKRGGKGLSRRRGSRSGGSRGTEGSLTVCTFHRFGLDVLSREARALGLRGGRFAIYDRGDCMGVLREVMRSVNSGRNYDLGAVLNRISLAKNAFLDPETYADSVARPDDPYDEVTAIAFPRYQQALTSLQAFDFDDLVCEPVWLWRRREEVLARWRMRYRHVIVDEYQDTNLAQLQMLRMLAADHRNLCVVGDDDQAIYAWRGADVRNILDFDKHFPGTSIVRLERNYRSTEAVLDVANAVLAASSARRHDKKLIPTQGAGTKVKLVTAEDGAAEARFVAAEAHRLIDGGQARARDIAVLYRSNLQAGELEAELKARGVVYQMFGGTQTWERKEVKDLLAYLETAVDGTELAVRRSLNYPPRGIGDAALGKLTAHASAQDLSIYRAVERAHAVVDLGAQPLEGCRAYLRVVGQLRSLMEEKRPAVEIVQALCGAIDMKRQIQAEAGDNLKAGARRWANVEFLLRVCARRDEKGPMDGEGWRQFLRRLLLREESEDAEQGSDKVTLTTMHGAKGLEYRVVFVVGLEEGLMPHARTLDDRVTDAPALSVATDEIEQERRLFYVAVTRAREQLYLCRARARLARGKAHKRAPSRFLLQIPEELLEVLDVDEPQTDATEVKRGADGVLAALLSGS
jgi:DNA helicase-2/ATP-dependent DNA helicase PcrA